MPLVIMCGLPCSGKSKRANELYGYLLSSSKKSVLIQDDSIKSNFSRNETFSGNYFFC